MVVIVQCDQCATRYQVPDEKLSAAGTKARCKQCGHIMTLYRPGPEEPAEVPRVPATAAEVPVAPDPPRPVAKRASRQKARAAPIVTWRSLLLVGALAVLVGVGVSYVLGQVVNRSLATFIATIFK